jgi:hypothetical protein
VRGRLCPFPTGGEGTLGVTAAGPVGNAGLGTIQTYAAKYLHSYLAEFDFRFNNRMGLGVHDCNVRSSRSSLRLASVSRTGELINPDYSRAANRFIRWRKKNTWKPPKRRVKWIWIR